MREVFDRAISQAQLPPQRHYLVVVPDDAPATCEVFSDLPEMVARLRVLHSQPVQVFPFSGTRLVITHPPRYLLSELGRWPLFDTTTDSGVDPDGRLGPPVIERDAPAPEVTDTGEVVVPVAVATEDDPETHDEAESEVPT